MKKTALLIVDVQNDVVAKAHARDEVVASIQGLLTRARAEKIPVVWIQHSSREMPVGSEGWNFVPELKPLENEILIPKIHGDSFEDTGLKVKLDGLGVGRVIVTGAQTDACVRATLHGAFVRGYDTVLVSDAHTTEDLTAYGLPSPEQLIAFTNAYWTWQTGPGRAATVEKSADVKLTEPGT